MTGSVALTISALGQRGEGIADWEGKRIFVPRTLPGETVSAEIVEGRAFPHHILSASPDRIAPLCSHFGSCGGCQLQHMAPSAYLDFKAGLVADQLARAGIVAQVNAPVIAHGAGRRRVTLHATSEGAGFMGLRSHTLHPIDLCPILVPALADAPAIASEAARLVGPCDVAITATDAGRDVSVRAKAPRNGARLAGLVPTFKLARIALNGEPVVIDNAPFVTMGRARVPLPPGGFLQATAAGEEALAGLVLDAAKGAKRVADLFCGIGPFALRLAERHRVFAADSEGAAIEALAEAARRTQGLKPIEARKRDLFRDPLSPFELSGFDAVVIDPPRAGAQAQVRELAQSKVPAVLYVSCDPQSFARDAAVLIAAGYGMGPVTPVDQFAYSAHVELFAAFTRSPAKRTLR